MSTASPAPWQLGFNDNYPLGWLITAGYFLTLVLCFLAARASAQGGEKNGGRFWMVLAGFFLLMGLNKQLDLQTLLLQWGRGLAREEGWMEMKVAFRAGVVAFCGIGAVRAWFKAWELTRQTRYRPWLVFSGIVILGFFLLLSAMSVHYVEPVFGLHLGCRKTNWALELSGTGLIALAAWRSLQTRTRFQEPLARSQDATGH